MKFSESVQFFADLRYRGYFGPMTVDYTYNKLDLMDSVIKAHNNIGVPTNDFNGKRFGGVSKVQRNVINGQRNSPSRAYLTKKY